ncbi:putative ribonuclease H-like domain-containing protein [Tanacetum coccineum]
MPPTPDLSFTGLDEFVNKPVVENCKAMSSKEDPKVVRKNDDAPCIEEWVSDDEEDDVSQPKTEKKTVGPSIVKKEFVKSKQQEKTTRKTVKQVEGKNVNTARPKAVVNVVQGNNVNAVKALACWVWKPKTKVLDHGNPQMDLQDKGVINSGCSRHMTGNMSYLTDYEEIDGGYVAFGGNPKRKKITEKCTIKTATKDKTSGILKSFITGIENLVDHKVKVIRCDNGTEFKNREMNQFCKMKGILRQFSVARTPQQNRVAERRNRTLIEAARTMLADSKLPTTFWAEAINIACYVEPKHLTIVNAASTNEVNAVSGKISIELLDDLNMPALEDYNIFDFTRDNEDNGVVADMNNLDTTIQVSPIPTTRIHKDHPLDQVIRDLQSATQTRIMSKNLKEHGRTQKGNSCIEGSKLDRGYAGRASTIQATRSLDFSEFTKWKKGYRHLSGRDWVYVMKFFALLLRIEAIGAIFSLCLHLKIFGVSNGCNKLLFSKVKIDEEVLCMSTHLDLMIHIFPDRSMIGSLMYITSARPDIMFAVYSPFDLVAYTDSDYAGASLDRKSTTGGCCGKMVIWDLESNYFILAYAPFKDFVVYQKGVKSAFLYGKIKEEVYWDLKIHTSLTEYTK